MDALPCEIMLAILEWLERPGDLVAIGMTSRCWHEVASDDRLWRALLRRRFPKWADDVERFARIDPSLRPGTAKGTLRMLVTCAACGRVPPMAACGRRGKGTRPNETLFAFNADGASKKVAHARLCGSCMDPSVGGAATKTDLKKRFMLNNDDLDALPYVERCNPYYRGSWAMRLYIVAMAERVAMRKFGSQEEFDAAWQKREAAAAKRREVALSRRRERQATEAAVLADIAARKAAEQGDVCKRGRKRKRPDRRHQSDDSQRCE
ncbi:F-box domain containing protein [Pandoravirus quercus]|uniref:F-box domain containing protein n=1 Tax=Pandoravirus quercus TaxID=2107709 RepID=A0A2U7UAM6_9VIRU|nr:F-box domain containing protein [Pandoravirus quercus]AVK75435.1 F-box domain containing protein [Pandoravirus quercus]